MTRQPVRSAHGPHPLRGLGTVQLQDVERHVGQQAVELAVVGSTSTPTVRDASGTVRASSAAAKMSTKRGLGG